MKHRRIACFRIIYCSRPSSTLARSASEAMQRIPSLALRAGVIPWPNVSIVTASGIAAYSLSDSQGLPSETKLV
jgi:hypothetical protein